MRIPVCHSTLGVRRAARRDTEVDCVEVEYIFLSVLVGNVLHFPFPLRIDLVIV